MPFDPKTPYDVADAMYDIELSLIESMKRTMKAHIKDESINDIDWSQWQAEQLLGLKQFKDEYSSLTKKQFKSIEKMIEEVLVMSYNTGVSEQEIELLELAKNKPKVIGTKNWKKGISGTFFRVNNAKLNAIIEEATNRNRKATSSILRYCEDTYRKTIFNAQIYANSGAGTIWQAVDMAHKDFLSVGLNCIRYENGALMNITSYSEMAIRTASTRAYMVGASKVREEAGIYTVLISNHDSACPACVQYQGKVYNDDVYTAGYDSSKNDDKFPLLSSAIAGGMFHPNCRNTISLYIDGISTKPKEPTEEEKQEQLRKYKLEQQQRYSERNVRKYKKLEAGATDDENKKKYSSMKQKWEKNTNQLIKNNGDILREDRERLKNRFKKVDRTKIQPPPKPTPPPPPPKPKLNVSSTGLISNQSKKSMLHHVDGMDELLRNSNSKIVNVWNTYSKDIVIGSLDEKRAHASSGWMYFNLDEDAKNVVGKYNTAFHEFAHGIDYLAYLKHSKTIQTEYVTFDYRKHPIQLFSNYFVSNKHKATLNDMLVKEFKEIYSIQKDIVAKELAKIGDARKPLQADVYWAIRVMMKQKYSTDTLKDVSDIVGGLTKNKINLGWGHKNVYWTYTKPSCEAFAEMFSAYITDANSLGALKEFFPKSLEVFEEMLEEMIK